MAKETEERLIRALEFLKEPQGSTISTIVKAMNGDGPQVSLKKIVQTLRGCLENGILTVSDGRVKFKQVGPEPIKEKIPQTQERSRSGCMKPSCQTKPLPPAKGLGSRTFRSRSQRSSTRKPRIPVTGCQGEEPGGEGGEPAPAADGQCPECPSCKKKKKKPKCPKPKPKCPRPKPKCPKPKPKCPKPKPKCKKPKPKCKKPKKKPKKKCAKKINIQPYCKKKKCPQ